MLYLFILERFVEVYAVGKERAFLTFKDLWFVTLMFDFHYMWWKTRHSCIITWAQFSIVVVTGCDGPSTIALLSAGSGSAGNSFPMLSRIDDLCLRTVSIDANILFEE